MNKIDLHEKKILIVSQDELEELERALVGRECWLSDRIENHNQTIKACKAANLESEDGFKVLKMDLDLYKERLNRVSRLADEVNRLRQGEHLIEG